MGSRFFVSSSSTYWDSTSAWSLTSGGAGGASVPGPADIAYFDSGGAGTCVIDSPVDIAGLRLDSDYMGTIRQSDAIEIGEEDASFCGGTFIGGSSSITINSSAHLCGTEFRSTSGTLEVVDSFVYEYDQSGSLIPQQIVTEELTLSSQSIADKLVSLSYVPADETNVTLNIIGGAPQEYGSDYYVDGNDLIWAGLALDGKLSSGDKLRILYENSGDLYPGYFSHRNGTLKLHYSSTLFSCGGIELYDLKLQDGVGYREIDGSCFVMNDTEFYNGYLVEGSDSTMYFEGDMTCQSSFGDDETGSGIAFIFDGSNQQTLMNYTGAILPNIIVDKHTNYQLKAMGTGPIRIAGDLSILDGTFNTNGLSLEVGVLRLEI